MDILVIALGESDRAGRLERFVAEKGHRAVNVALGVRLPATMQTPLGAVYFDQGEANFLQRVREARERVRYLGIALVVVTQREKPEEQAKLRAAGADLLCDPGTPDALIFKELQGRRQAMEASAEMHRDLAAPLMTAFRQATREMTTVEFAAQLVQRRAAPAGLGDIAAVLELSAPPGGLLVTSFSTGTAEALARQVFAQVREELTPALIQDCMGEITNVVAGQAKALLHGTPYHFTFSPPQVYAVKDLNLPEKMDSLVIAFDSDIGGCALQHCSPRH